jgi:cytosine permease
VQPAGESRHLLLIGYFVSWGLPSINSLAAAFVLYVVAGKLGLVRGVGVSRTIDSFQPVDQKESV